MSETGFRLPGGGAVRLLALHGGLALPPPLATLIAMRSRIAS